MPDARTGACAGLTVVDLGQGMAGALPGMILADNGARVVKVEPPGGDWARDRPGFLMWNRGKLGVVLDLHRAGDRARLSRLLEQADVLIDSFRPGTAERLGLSHSSVNPRLIHCSIDGPGPAAALAEVPGYEGLVSAAIGRMVGLDHLNGAVAGQDRAAPIFTAPPVLSYGAAQLAVHGILAALHARRRTGRGDRVRTSLVQAAAAFLMRQELPRGGGGARLGSPVVHAGIELCFMTARCRDGRFLQMCARQDAHFRNWLDALGLAHLLTDARFAGAPLGMRSLADVAELDALIRQRMATRPRDEWMRLFTGRYDVGADPFLTPAEFLYHSELVDNDRIVELDDPMVGPCRQIGPLVLLSDTPATVRGPAPGLGQHTEQVFGELRSAGIPVPDAAPAAAAGPPLHGVTVVELAYYIAGPGAGSLLAQLGARVIKVEPLDGDPYRRTGLQAAKFLDGKESIALDLKSAEGVEILHRLVTGADLFVHSFRPGVPERLGVDYATLSALNPALIYLYAAAYGSRGRQAARSAFHSTPNALSGAGIVQAGEGNPPVDDSFPDPGSALAAATAMLLGLAARDRTGRGQALETTMLASTGYIMSPWLVSFDGAPPAVVADHGQHGFGALYRLYRCAEGWLFVSCVRPAHWPALAGALDHAEWCGDRRFRDPSARHAHSGELAAAIEDALQRRPAAAWAARLRKRGVPAVEVFEQPQETWFELNGLLTPATHPLFGDYWQPPAKVTFASAPSPRLRGAAIGEHTAPLLAELGYSAEVIDRLRTEKVIGCWSEPGAGRAA